MESKTNLKISMITKFDRYINESVGKKIGPLYHGSDTLFDKFEFKKLIRNLKLEINNFYGGFHET